MSETVKCPVKIRNGIAIVSAPSKETNVLDASLLGGNHACTIERHGDKVYLLFFPQFLKTCSKRYFVDGLCLNDQGYREQTFEIERYQYEHASIRDFGSPTFVPKWVYVQYELPEDIYIKFDYEFQ
jgi:hypothetical protein